MFRWRGELNKWMTITDSINGKHYKIKYCRLANLTAALTNTSNDVSLVTGFNIGEQHKILTT